MIEATRIPSGEVSSYRWVILALTFLGGLTQNLLWLSSVPLVLAVERELVITGGEVAFWLNIPVVCGVFLCIPIGLSIASRGAKHIGRISVALLAIGGIARGFANSFEFLLAASILFGIGYMSFFLSQSASLAVWFPSKEIGMAQGVFLTGTGVGSALGLSAVQPIFGNAWRECFVTLGWLGIATAVAWWLLAKDGRMVDTGKRRSEEALERFAMKSAFETVLSKRTTWLLVLGFFCYIAGFQSWFTFGFPFLVRFRNMEESSAGIILTLTMIGYTLAAVSMPALSDRVGRRKPFFIFYAALAASLFVILALGNSTAFVWAAAVLIGMCFGTINPLVFAVAAEARELGPALMGTSLGIIVSLGSIAGLLVPVALGTSLGTLSTATEDAFQIVWLVTSAWAVGIFVCGMLLEETGPVGQGSTKGKTQSSGPLNPP